MTSENPKLQKALDLIAAIEERKALYDELDALVLELRAEGFQSAIVGEATVEIRDNFAETNTQWRMAAVKRWELVVRKPKAERKRRA